MSLAARTSPADESREGCRPPEWVQSVCQKHNKVAQALGVSKQVLDRTGVAQHF